MVSEDALIQQGIRYSDNLFKIIEERVLKALEQSSSLEEFLERTKDFTLQNPMVSTGYQDTMTNLITSITNNVRFERAAQRELVRTAISSRVGELIQNVGDDLKESIRETVKQGYDEGLHSRDIAKRMSHNIQSINSRRARTIARTEVARAYVISDYIVNKERGATGFTVVCRPDCCPICAEDYAGRKNHVPDVDGDGRLIGGNVGFLIDDVGMLPPRHPNCRCSVNYFRADGDEIRSKISRKKPTSTATTTTTSTGGTTQREPTKDELSKNLTPSERAKYSNYRRVIANHTKWLEDNPSAAADVIANHKAKLAKAQAAFNELRAKALGGIVGGDTPIQTPKPKPKVETKPKTTATTNPKAKPKGNSTIPKPTAKQLKENLTPDELRKYKRWLREIKEGKMSPDFIEMRKRDVENLRRKALGLEPLSETSTPKSKPKTSKSTQTSKKSEEFGGKELSAKELKDILPPATYKKFQEASKKIMDTLEELSSEKSKSRRKFLESRIGFFSRHLDELEQIAIDKSKPKTTRNLEKPFDETKHLTKQQLDKMTFKEIAEHHGAEYKGIEKNEYDDKRYHVIEQTCSNGETFKIYFEQGAVKSYANGGYATPNEIIHEVFKIPEALRKETDAIWFKNTQKGIIKNYGKSRYDSLAKNEGGYNKSHKLINAQFDKFDSPEHEIVINPSYFKKGKNRGYLPQTGLPTEELGWKHALYHEFVHSADKTRENWIKRISKEISFMAEYDEIEEAEPYFTGYANFKRVESFAEHGGYIARMESNPSDRNRKILIRYRDEEGYSRTKSINYEEYKKMYPKHYEFFMRKFKEGF